MMVSQNRPDYSTPSENPTRTVRDEIRKLTWLGYIVGSFLIAAVTLVIHLVGGHFVIDILPILYVLVITFIAYLFGKGPSVLSFLLALFFLVFIIVPPEYSIWPKSLNLETRAHLILIVLGSLIGIIGALYIRKVNQTLQMEIAERKQTEESLREIQIDLNRAQAVAHTGSWRMDVRHNVLLWSDEVYRIFGIPRGTELTYETFLSNVHPDDKDFVDTSWKAALGGETYDIEHRIVVGNEVKWVRERAELEFDSQGVLQGGFGTVQDFTERKRAEKLLKGSEAFLRQVIDTAPSMIFVKDWNGRFVLVNKSLAHTYGSTHEEIVGKTDAAFNPNAEEVEHFLQDDRQVMSTRQNKLIPEEPVTHADGVVHWYNTVKVPLINSDGTCDKVLGISTDITERKQVEEKLRRYELLAANTRDIVLFIRRDDGRIIEANTAATKAYGYSREEFLTLHIQDLRADKTKELTADQMAEADVKGILFETVHQRKDGSTFPVEVSSQGATIGDTRTLISVIRNITERKQAEHKLAEAHTETERRAAELLVILDAVPAGVWIAHDPESHLITGNRGASVALKTSGYVNMSKTSPEPERIDTFRIFKDGKELQSDEMPVQMAAKGNVMQDYEFDLLYEDGTIRHMFGNASPLIGEDGKPYGSVAAFVDITEMKTTELKLEQAKNEAERSAREEHEIAHTLQKGLAPPHPYIGGDYLTASAYIPAFTGEEIGGDFYDIFRTGDDRVAVLIGDVAGKGVTSAATAFLARSTIRAVASSEISLKDTMGKANIVIYNQETPEAFVTAYLVLINTESGRLQYISAGHPPAAVYRSNGSVDFLELSNIPMGIMENVEYSAGESYFGKGDKLVLYTDGVSEARRGSELFGRKGIAQVLLEHGKGTPRYVVDELLLAVDTWAQGKLTDDRAVLVIERKP